MKGESVIGAEGSSSELKYGEVREMLPAFARCAVSLDEKGAVDGVPPDAS